MQKNNRCQDTPPTATHTVQNCNLEVVFLELKKDVIIVSADREYKAFVSLSREFKRDEIEFIKGYALEKIKSLDLKPSDQLVVIDIVDDLRMLIENRL